jgi:hypothetical protein
LLAESAMPSLSSGVIARHRKHVRCLAHKHERSVGPLFPHVVEVRSSRDFHAFPEPNSPLQVRSSPRTISYLVRVHSGQLDELDVEGILAFAERVLPRAADMWVQASLDQRQRFQQLFFPEGISFNGNGFVRTAATAPAFSYLRPIESGNEGLVDQNSASWNRVTSWLRIMDALRRVA